MAEPIRTLTERKNDALRHLRDDTDLWVSTGDRAGVPCLVPLSFWWSESEIYFATIPSNPTGQNINQTGLARAALGNPRDVILIEARAEQIPDVELRGDYGDGYVAKCGWDPRASKSYKFFRLLPQRVEVFRDLTEHADREVMKDGKWLA